MVEETVKVRIYAVCSRLTFAEARLLGNMQLHFTRGIEGFGEHWSCRGLGHSEGQHAGDQRALEHHLSSHDGKVTVVGSEVQVRGAHV